MRGPRRRESPEHRPDALSRQGGERRVYRRLQPSGQVRERPGIPRIPGGQHHRRDAGRPGRDLQGLSGGPFLRRHGRRGDAAALPLLRGQGQPGGDHALPALPGRRLPAHAGTHRRGPGLRPVGEEKRQRQHGEDLLHHGPQRELDRVYPGPGACGRHPVLCDLPGRRQLRQRADRGLRAPFRLPAHRVPRECGLVRHGEVRAHLLCAQRFRRQGHPRHGGGACAGGAAARRRAAL